MSSELDLEKQVGFGKVKRERQAKPGVSRERRRAGGTLRPTARSGGGDAAAQADSEKQHRNAGSERGRATRPEAQGVRSVPARPVASKGGHTQPKKCECKEKIGTSIYIYLISKNFILMHFM